MNDGLATANQLTDGEKGAKLLQIESAMKRYFFTHPGNKPRRWGKRRRVKKMREST
jgi:hypothetical protein